MGLKILTVLAIYPAWAVIVLCVLSGREKSWGAIFAFAVFFVCTILHIIFDKRNRNRDRDVSGGFELGGGD